MFQGRQRQGSGRLLELELSSGDLYGNIGGFDPGNGIIEAGGRLDAAGVEFFAAARGFAGVLAFDSRPLQVGLSDADIGPSLTVEWPSHVTLSRGASIIDGDGRAGPSRELGRY